MGTSFQCLLSCMPLWLVALAMVGLQRQIRVAMHRSYCLWACSNLGKCRCMTFASLKQQILPAGMQQHGQVLSVLVELKGTAESFTQELRQSLLGVDVAELQPIAAAVFAPFESQISRYVSQQQTCGICDARSSKGCLHSPLYAAVKHSLLFPTTSCSGVL